MAYSRAYPAPPQPYNSASPIGGSRQVQQAPPAALPPVNIPPGTLPPGTIVHVGDYQVVVERFLSEGGFAHVYLANSSIPLPVGSPTATTKHVLKRMAVPDKRGVHEVGKEVEVMRQLKNHPKIVNMIEASVADLPGGVDGSKGYEIYILMEWCAGGGIIDMMNTRLQNRMTESEILKIFADTVEAVAHMHYQSPPLIHRDLKVENILLTPPQTYKLCDFGSTTKPLSRDKVPTAVEGIQKIELEINKTTTLQYRAPELVDVWGRKGFDEKIDIWALGVLLYKLCYYTTPFEEHGPLAILNAQYKFPPYPAYSPQIRSLVSSMLQERPENRPNIYQVHEMTCRLRGVSVRIENKYAMSSSSSGGLRAQANPLPARPTSAQPPPAPTANILSSNSQASSSTPNLTQLSGMQGLASQVPPMRRGRPGKNGGGIGGSKDGWAAFASPEPDQATSHSSTGGFGDAFVPTKTDIAQAKSPELPLETEVEMPKNMGMFQDLVSPKSEAQSRVEQDKKAKEEDDERKKFESTFPALMDDDLAPFGPRNPSTVSQQSQPPQLSSQPPLPSAPSPKPMPFQLTGEDAGPPLPRRPPSASPATPRQAAPSAPSLPSDSASSNLAPSSNRPLLVERGSQTSPHLLASWKNGSTASNTSSSGVQPPAAPANGRSGLRQSSIPEFDLSSPSEPSTSKPPAFDLLGDDGDSGLDSFAPGTVPLPASPQPNLLPKSPTLPPKPSFENSVANKRTSFLAPSSAPPGETKEREKFRPVRKSIAGVVESDGDKSEGKAEIEADVEERFPAIPDSAPSTSEGARREFEEVVERNEEGPDSSDDETPTPVPSSKVEKPSFSDDEDFAPRPIRQKAATAPVRPKFGTKPSSQSSLAAATNRMSLAASPAPLDTRSASTESLPTTLNRPYRSSTMGSVASSEGGGQGDIDLGPALASIRKFAPSSNDKSHSILDEQDEDDEFLPSTRIASSLSSAPSSATPTSTLPPLTSTTPTIATPTPTVTSPTPATRFVPTRPTSTQSPLLAPKPRKPAGINSLVSRYEGLGTSLTGGPPPVGSKPVGLRKDSTGSNTSLGRDTVNPRPLPSRSTSNTSNGTSHVEASKVTSPELANQRFPEQQNLDQRLNSPSIPSSPSFPPKSSTPSQYNNHAQPSSRVPFKPVPPPSSPQTSRSRYSLAGQPASAETSPNVEKGEEEEEKFAGVRNMKSRWESMSKPKEGDGGSQGRGADKRKSWAAV